MSIQGYILVHEHVASIIVLRTLTIMSVRQYLKPVSNLPTANQAGLPVNVPKEVNQAVATTLEWDKASPGKGICSKKWRYTTAFTPEDSAAIGRYVAENGIAAAVKKFKVTHCVGERTARLFKRYFNLLNTKLISQKVLCRLVPPSFTYISTSARS